MKYQIYYHEINDYIRIEKMIGQSPVVVVPSHINEKEVKEIGKYCFSKDVDYTKYQHTNQIENGTTLSLNYIEEVILPSTIQSIQACAFYNCKNLRKIKCESTIEFASDVFMNCTSLTEIEVPSFNEAKPLLKQISWSVLVKCAQGSLFFPEYYEVYNEIGPAHIFGINIEGEGYRMRQSFDSSGFRIDEYDQCFNKLSVEEKEKVVCKVVYYRMLIESKEIYETYLLQHQKTFSKLLTKDTIDYFSSYLDIETLDFIIERATKLKDSEFVTKCIAIKRKKHKKKTYDFEDFI